MLPGRTTENPLVKLPPLYQLAQAAQVRGDYHLAAEGSHARAGRLYGASEATLESTGPAFRAPHFIPSLHERYRARDELGDQTWSEALEEGRRMPLEQAIGYAFEDESGTA